MRTLFAGIRIVEITPQIAERAGGEFGVVVRSLDAIHVATAEVLANSGERVELWTHDTRLADAARSRGLDVRGA